MVSAACTPSISPFNLISIITNFGEICSFLIASPELATAGTLYPTFLSNALYIMRFHLQLLKFEYLFYLLA